MMKAEDSCRNMLAKGGVSPYQSELHKNLKQDVFYVATPSWPRQSV